MTSALCLTCRTVPSQSPVQAPEMGAFHSRVLPATHTPAPRAPNISGGCHTGRTPRQVSKEPVFFHSMRTFPGYDESAGTETVTKVGGTSPPMELTQQVSEWTHRRKATADQHSRGSTAVVPIPGIHPCVSTRGKLLGRATSQYRRWEHFFFLWYFLPS